MRPSDLKIHAALFLVSAIYGATYILAKEVMPAYVQPSGLILLRISGALILITAYHRLWVKERLQSVRDYLYMAVCGFFGVAFNMLLFFAGLARTSPIDASLIMVTTPLLVLLIGFLMRTEKITMMKIIGIVAGTAGAGLIILDTATVSRSGSVLGDFYVMVNASSFALYLVLVRPLMKRYKPMTIMLWTFIFGWLFVLPFGINDLLIANWETLHFSHWIIILFMIVGTTFIAYVLNAWALQYVRSSVVGSYVYLQPAMATLLAVATGKYALHWQHVLYGFFIFSGVYLVSRKGTQAVASTK